MEDTLISIIVPVYNTQRYIGECIESLMIQTYRNIEILVVDNGSDDGTYEICQEYAKKDPRIRLMRAGFRQQHVARNTALEEMRGEYFSYVDADDYVSENYIQKMYETAKEYDADMVICGYTAMLECRDDLIDVTRNTFKADPSKKLRKNNWAKLYRSDVYRSVRYKDMRMGSDGVYSTEIFEISTNVAYCGYSLYAYRAYIPSVTHANFNKAWFERLDRLYAEGDRSEFLRLAEKGIQVINVRREEQLYHKELRMLKDRIDKAKEKDYVLREELYQQLQTLIERSDVGMAKFAYLKLKHFYTSQAAAHRTRTNYRCKLD